uniref:Putative zinc-finger domain-containing protein n=1 Tax=Rhodosorus marinus TaxID=101924 RepID=A0A7S3EPJ3_9RHOD|mmetsp:Transcript_6988/g.30624  ORF Transcript_6988/g.30624 Transcript_6988/m.30624 type:complete len:1041 (+) Transcript_6988:1186-4308(+)
MTKKRNRFRRGKNRSGRADDGDASSSHADHGNEDENLSILFSRSSSKDPWEPRTRTDSSQPEFAAHDKGERRRRDSEEREIYVIDDDSSSQHDSERRHEEVASEIIHLDGRSPNRKSRSLGTHFVHSGLRDSPSPDHAKGAINGQSRNRSSEFDEILAQRKQGLGAEAAITSTGMTELRDHPSASNSFMSGADQPRKGATASAQRARTEGMSKGNECEPRELRGDYLGRSSSPLESISPQSAQQPEWASPAAGYRPKDHRSRTTTSGLSRNAPSLPLQPAPPPPASPLQAPAPQLLARPPQKSSPSTRTATTDARGLGAGGVGRNCEEEKIPEPKKPRVTTPDDGARSNAARKPASSSSALKKGKLASASVRSPRNQAEAGHQSNGKQTKPDGGKRSPASNASRKTNASTTADLRTSLRGTLSPSSKSRETVVELIKFFNQVLSHDEDEARANRARIERAEDHLKEVKARMAELDRRTRQNKRRLEGFRRILLQIPLAGLGHGDVEVEQKSRKREREQEKDLQPSVLSRIVGSTGNSSDSVAAERRKEGDKSALAKAGAEANGESQQSCAKAARRPSSDLETKKSHEIAGEQRAEEEAPVLLSAALSETLFPDAAKVDCKSMQDDGLNESIGSGVDEEEVPEILEESERLVDVNSTVSPNPDVKGAAVAVDNAAAPGTAAVKLEQYQPPDAVITDTAQPSAEEEMERCRGQNHNEPHIQHTAIAAKRAEPENPDANGPREVNERPWSGPEDGLMSENDLPEVVARPVTEEPASSSHDAPIEGASTAHPKRGARIQTEGTADYLGDHSKLTPNSRLPQREKQLTDPGDEMLTAGRQRPPVTTGAPSAAGATSVRFPDEPAESKGSASPGEKMPSNFGTSAEIPAVPFAGSPAAPLSAQLREDAATTTRCPETAPGDSTQNAFTRQSDSGWWIHSSRARRLRAFGQDHLRMDKLCYNFIDPQRALCPWELHGKCQSKSCDYQHFHDFAATPVEVLEEVLCYCPDGIYKLTSVRLKRRYLSGEKMPKILKEALAVCGFTDGKS